MKHVLAIFLMICFAASCSDNMEDPESGSLVGTWDLVGMSSVADGETHTIPQEEIDADPLTYTLNEDSTGIQYYKEKNSEFHWVTTDPNTLVFSSYNETHKYSYTVNSENLNLTFPLAKYTITHTFSRR